MRGLGVDTGDGVPMNINKDKEVRTDAPRIPKRGPVSQYFAEIWAGVSTTYLGMKLTIGYFFSKPVTMLYPEVRPEIPESHRGLHAFDEPKCTLCKLCKNNCPVNCIEIEGLGRAKDTLVTRYDVDYTRCLFCNICVETCPMHCIRLTEKYNLAAGSRDGCKLRLARPKSDADIAEFKALLERKEAEKKAKAAQKEAEKKLREQQEGQGRNE
jgi:NADH-quinone oxidoreductase subunit I